MNTFWNWIRDDTGGRVLRLEGPIDAESFWGDEITPQAFREELEAEEGDIVVWINSPGGNVFAAAEIYTMLKEYAGTITVRIASIAASAASVVAMAGDLVEMSPTALLMIHDPMTMAMGNAKDMERAITTLNEVKESIVNADVAKTGLRRNKVAELMSNETWMNAKKAVELGFADLVLYERKRSGGNPPGEPEEEEPETEEGGGAEGKENEEEKNPFTLKAESQLYSSRLMGQTILNRIMGSLPKDASQTGKDDRAKTSDPFGEEFDEGGQAPEVFLTDDPPEEGPVIGMDGKTADGSVPYTILKKQLEFLR